MIKHIVYFCLLLVLISFNSCKVEKKVTSEDHTLIAIVNPHVGSLVKFKSLIDNGILDIPNAQYLAVCYDQVERNIVAVENFINEQSNDLFRLEILSGALPHTDLFMENSLSKQFLKIFQKTEGIFFLGGADIPPTIYDQKTNLLSSITTPKRHLFELSFLFHLLGGSQDTSFNALLEMNKTYKVVGFCLGMQTMNVATGGTMHQDIPSNIYNLNYVEDVLAMDNNQRHLNYWQRLAPEDDMIWSNFHQIKSIKSHHFFNEDLWSGNSNPFVYSSHHQAVQSVGNNLDIIATSMDGKVVEIIIHNKYENVFGVQFHPEVSSLYLSDQKQYKWTPDDLVPKSYYEFLVKSNSLSFHKKFWQKVSSLYQH